nr:immunoglobulin light chain junction region [Macaca mulatta]MOV37253.1 immunoglobulin light chain junction region [Macaca mulatta]MOV37421.1 immunoglobulin light chain junction region [Macaca mulatta]MOV37435.1 immunoglobulin light chain junction region [Macaca mulatta]MOV37485.1 immunoglobulin light chain junction region [Macaca mulatta]
CLQRNYSPFTF